MQDHFRKPAPFSPDVVVAIDDVIDLKAQMLHCHASQMYEWLPYDGGYLGEVPEGDAQRLDWLRARQERRDAAVADRFRDQLIARYGEERGRAIRCAEAFEVSEYGRGLADEEVSVYFPE